MKNEFTLAFNEVLEDKGLPKEVILDEAERWGADLIVVGSRGYGSISRFMLGELQRWAEIVGKQAPFVHIEVVYHWDEFRIVEAIIAEQLSDMCPVFLLNKGVVVLSVRS